MKKVKKLWIVACCILLLITTLSGVVSAAPSWYTNWSNSDSGPKPEASDGEWAHLGGALEAYADGNYFVIKTTATLESSGKQYTELLYISVPETGGFRVQAQHEYQEKMSVGADDKDGELFPMPPTVVEAKPDSTGARVLTGTDGTSVKITTSQDGFKLLVSSPKYPNIVSITNKQISYSYQHDEVVRIRIELPVTADGKEVIYEGGEIFNEVNQVGETTALSIVSNGGQLPFTYNLVPMFHSNRGYTIWFNMNYPGVADIGDTDPLKASIAFDGDKMDFVVWAGTPAENLKKYTGITGTSGVHEEYAYSFWGGGNNEIWDRNYARTGQSAYENMVEFYEGYMANYGFYPRVMGEELTLNTARDLQYQRSHGSVGLGYFNQIVEAKRDISEDLQTTSLPVFASDGTLIDAGWPLPYDDALYNKGIYQTIESTHYDPSNPNYAKVIANNMGGFWKLGQRGGMVDFGELSSYRGIYWNGLSGMEMHNLAPYYAGRTFYEVYTELYGNDYILYARAGAPGSQKFIGNFLGDQGRRWDHYHRMLYSMINLGASGFNNYGGDLFFNYYGTTEGAAAHDGSDLTTDLGARHIAFCALSPYYRQHGVHLIMPWKSGDVINQTFGSYYYLRENLIPSIMSAAIDANKNSTPMVQGMMFAYPYQLRIADNNNQYLFCDDFLVCTVDQPGFHNWRASLPDGETWYDLFTHKRYEGGQEVLLEAPLTYIPILVKAGAVKAIDLPDSQVLSAEMHPLEQVEDASLINDYEVEETPHDSLLITPPDKERTTTIYVKEGKSRSFQDYDHRTEVYTSKPENDSTFTITNIDGSERETVLALGVTASAVYCDDVMLERLDHIPDYNNREYGYYVEASGLTTILLPLDWHELKIVKGDAGYVPYTLQVDEREYGSMVDGNISTSCEITSLDEEIYFTIDADGPQEIGRIILKWATGYLSSYDIEVSSDGENWELLIGDEDAEGPAVYGEHYWSMDESKPDAQYTVTRGAGGLDIISLEGVTAQFIRLVPQELEANDKWASGSPATLAIFEAYPPISLETLNPDETQLPDYDGGDEDEDWDDEYDDWYYEYVEEDGEWGDVDDLEGDDPTGGNKKPAGSSGKKKKMIITTYGWPWWVIAIIIGAGVLVVTGLVLLFILLAKKKKKKALAAAEAAVEAAEPADPTDFEVPPET